MKDSDAAKQHKYPVGTLVETHDGSRAFVVRHTYDYDQTPLYVLSLDKDDTEPLYKSIGLSGLGWSGGWPEELLASVVLNKR